MDDFFYNFHMQNNLNVDVLVIGGGPGGMLCSIMASEKRKVLLLDKPGKTSSIGKRILVSGNGRANFFNEELFSTDFEPHYQFLLRDDKKDYAKEFFSYLDGQGFNYMKEGNLYYPYFRRSECLYSFLVEKMNHVDIQYGLALNVDTGNNVVCCLMDGKKTFIHYQDLVICIGGRSFDREDYSYELLDSLGISYYPYKSMLCPVRTKEKIPSYLSKQRLRMRLHLLSNGKEIYVEEGEILFKDDGISGIAVFNSTKYIHECLRKNPKSEFVYQIDYAFDGLSAGTSLSSYPSFLRRYLEENKINPTSPLIFHYREMYPFRESQASYGGILLSEMDKSTLTLKKHKNIYCIGEMLDANLKCGGYNMGFSFVEGYRVGWRLMNHGK